MSHHARREVLVIGAGIVGLTSAIRFQQAGWHVRIWTADDPLETVSAIAAALWYPYRVYPEDRVRLWSASGFDHFLAEADVAPGVRRVAGTLLWRGERPPSTRDIPEARELSPSDVPTGYAGGCAVRLPVIEMPLYLPHLASRIRQGGGTIERRRIASLDDACAASRVVVNACGLGARALCQDETVTPIRGQVVRVRNPGLTQFVVDVDAPHGAMKTFERKCVVARRKRS